MTRKPTYEELLKIVKDQQASIETHRALIENMPDLFYRADLEGRLSYVSPAVYRLAGYTVEEAIGMRMAEEIYLVPEARMAFLAKLKEKGQVANFEAQLKRKDGSIWWASTNAHFYKDKEGNIIGVEGITRDISELKIAEISLRAAEERFRLAFHTSPDAINLNRASDGMFIDINQGFTDLTGYTRKDVVGKTSLEINIWKNIGDREQLVDGLMKTGFVKNLEAQFVRKNGEVGVGLMSARTLKVNDEDVILSVTRDITERKQAEEATQKLEKQLMQAQKLEAIGRLAGGIAHDLNNLLSPILGYSEPGKGTTFKVYLPVSENMHHENKIIPQHSMDPRGSETILLVEDSEQVRDIVGRILERHGYRVFKAANGTEALESVVLPEESVDLLLTDVVMPEMNGKELYAKLAKDFPTLKIIYMSGYTDNVIVHHGVLDEGVHFIQKPFITHSLVTKVREVLDG